MLIKLIEHIVKTLVERPSSVIVREIEVDNKRIIQISVSPLDLGRVIGGEGRTFKALRSLVCTLTPEADLVVDSAD